MSRRAWVLFLLSSVVWGVAYLFIKIAVEAGLHPAFVANLNGDEFISDPATVLSANDYVLILSEDAGG